MLLDRSRKPVTATIEGKVLFKQFRHVLAEFHKIEQIVCDLKGELAGEYRLAIIPNIAPGLLPNLLQKIGNLHPKIHLQIAEMITNSIIQRVLEGSLDGGILAIPLKQNQIQQVAFYLEPIQVFHSHRLAIKESPSIKDLPLASLVTLDQDHCLRHQTLELCQMEAKAKKSLHFDIKASSLQSLVNLIRTGEYFTFFPETACHMLILQERKAQVKTIQEVSPMREVGFISHRSQIKATINSVVMQITKELMKNFPIKNPENGSVLSPV